MPDFAAPAVWKDRRVLVTGAAGFLGSHLTDHLLALGATVVGLDNGLTGSDANLVSARASARFSFVRQDVCDPLSVAGAVDVVFHLASPASPKDYLAHPVATLRTCSVGTENVLGFAESRGSTVVLASTSEIYGDPTEHPQSESYRGNVDCTNERACYTEGKRFLEATALAWHRTRDVRVRIARIFNTYGPRMRPDDGRVVSTFCVQALAGGPLTVHGDGSQTRSFCHVDDLVSGLLALALSDVVGPTNLGNPHEVSMRALADTIRRLAASTSTLRHVSRPEGDPSVRRPDIGRARELLGFEPRIDLESGLVRTLDWYRTMARPPHRIATS
ncbi:MAG: NAD-dependent epimerase/dehydratase family protein [Polyangiaceae bacterium]